MSAGPQDLLKADLALSGLVPEDIAARLIENAERATIQVPAMLDGYVIPYYTLYGRILPFYRVRLFNHDPKYKQPKDTQNHVYFPKSFLKAQEGKKYVIITEGEKKAALACKTGIPCVALGGVDSWRNRIILLPAEAALSADGAKTQVKLASGEGAEENYDSPVAQGFQELLDHVLQNDLHIIIIFDSDNEMGVKADVQRAAAVLGYELRFRGVPFDHIRQILLPRLTSADYHQAKVGLDDYLMHRPGGEFIALVTECLARRSAFPRHPSIRDYINKRLQKTRLSRKETQSVSLAILSDLDANGIRLRSPSGLTYYFDHKTKRLLLSSFAVNASRDEQFDAPFTQFLYQRYGLSGADNRLLLWLGTQFTSEQPIQDVSPYKVIARLNPADDCVNLQLSDSQYVRVDKEGIHVLDNGSNNILFEADQVEPLNIEQVVKGFKDGQGKPIPNQWGDTLSEVRLKDREKQRIATSLLYYMSPFLHRWRGLQLPVELILGESGSGKSTLMELRLDILTGRPVLRNAPTDLKDWHASVTSTGGLHVTDNVQFADKSLRQRLSDEICRIVTEPNPSIEQRKYYTNADLIRLPVRTVFAITAIQQPFQNVDLLQRAVILDLDKSIGGPDLRYNSEWKTQQLRRFGGREGWIAHHLVVLHRFFQLVAKNWDPRYEAKHRLIHFEQTMSIMAQVFGLPKIWVPEYLNVMTERVVSENDWVLEGLKAYVTTQMNGHSEKTCAAEISAWAMTEEDYAQCEILINSRRVGRYLQQHKSLVQQLTGLVECGTVNNRMMYKANGRPRPSNKIDRP